MYGADTFSHDALVSSTMGRSAQRAALYEQYVTSSKQLHKPLPQSPQGGSRYYNTRLDLSQPSRPRVPAATPQSGPSPPYVPTSPYRSNTSALPLDTPAARPPMVSNLPLADQHASESERELCGLAALNARLAELRNSGTATPAPPDAAYPEKIYDREPPLHTTEYNRHSSIPRSSVYFSPARVLGEGGEGEDPRRTETLALALRAVADALTTGSASQYDGDVPLREPSNPGHCNHHHPCGTAAPRVSEVVLEAVERQMEDLSGLLIRSQSHGHKRSGLDLNIQSDNFNDPDAALSGRSGGQHPSTRFGGVSTQRSRVRCSKSGGRNRSPTAKERAVASKALLKALTTLSPSRDSHGTGRSERSRMRAMKTFVAEIAALDDASDGDEDSGQRDQRRGSADTNASSASLPSQVRQPPQAMVSRQTISERVPLSPCSIPFLAAVGSDRNIHSCPQSAVASEALSHARLLADEVVRLRTQQRQQELDYQTRISALETSLREANVASDRELAAVQGVMALQQQRITTAYLGMDQPVQASSQSLASVNNKEILTSPSGKRGATSAASSTSSIAPASSVASRSVAASPAGTPTVGLSSFPKRSAASLASARGTAPSPQASAASLLSASQHSLTAARDFGARVKDREGDEVLLVPSP